MKNIFLLLLMGVFLSVTSSTFAYSNVRGVKHIKTEIIYTVTCTFDDGTSASASTTNSGSAETMYENCKGIGEPSILYS